MGEWLPASIRVSGELPHWLLDDLVEAIREDGLGFDWAGAEIDAADVRARLGTDPGAPLRLTNPQSCYGNLDATSAFCRAHGLAYTAHNDAHGPEIEAENERWEPGWDEPRTGPSNQAEDDLVRLAALETALAAGATLAEVVAGLRERAGPDTLAPFALVAGPPAVATGDGELR